MLGRLLKSAQLGASLRNSIACVCSSCLISSHCSSAGHSRSKTNTQYRQTPSRNHKISAAMVEGKGYKDLEEFYPFYQTQHSKTGTRVLHMLGTSLFLAQAAAAAHQRDARLLLSGIVSAYGCAWIGHFFIERNKPATFKYPFLSLLGDFRMYVNILTGRGKITGT